MNTGSNPVGVADSNTAESQGQKPENCTGEQASGPPLARRVRKAGLCKRRGCKSPGNPATRLCAFHEAPGFGPVMCSHCRYENQVVPGTDRCGKCALTVTAGKNGAPELPAVGEEAGSPPEAAPIRCCKGSYGTGPEDGCDAVLGHEVVGDYCAACLRFQAERADAMRAREVRERASDAASGRSESIVFLAAGDIAAISVRRARGALSDDLLFSVYDHDGIIDLRPLISATLPQNVRMFLREVLK